MQKEVNLETNRSVTKLKRSQKRRKSAGFTLLEYSAGAAILMGVLFAALTTFGEGLKTLFAGIGQWSSQQVSNLPTGTSSKN